MVVRDGQLAITIPLDRKPLVRGGQMLQGRGM